jgi:hypothetical protein
MILIFVWLVFSFAIALIISLILMDLYVMNIIFSAELTFIFGWSLVFLLFLAFQVLMYKSHLLSSKRSSPPVSTGARAARMTPSSIVGTGKSLEQGEFSGVAQNLKRGEGSTFFSLIVSGARKPAFYWVEATVEGLALNEGDSVWVKGKVGKDGILRTAEVRNFSEAGSSGEAVVSGSEVSSQGFRSTGPVVGSGQVPVRGGVDAAGNVGKRNCPMCGGTGAQKIMQWKTVMEHQTVNEQVTQFRFGKPVRVTVPKTVQKPVQKPDYRMVQCKNCKGTGKV